MTKYSVPVVSKLGNLVASHERMLICSCDDV